MATLVSLDAKIISGKTIKNQNSNLLPMIVPSNFIRKIKGNRTIEVNTLNKLGLGVNSDIISDTNIVKYNKASDLLTVTVIRKDNNTAEAGVLNLPISSIVYIAGYSLGTEIMFISQKENTISISVYVIEESIEDLINQIVADAAGSGGTNTNIANSDLDSDDNHIWSLEGFTFQIANIGEYFAIGDPEMGGALLVQPGDNMSLIWVDNEDVDTPMYSNQIAVGSKQTQIAVGYNGITNYAGIVAEKDKVFIRVTDGTNTQLIEITPASIAVNGLIASTKDIEITDSTKGIILKSPDGTRYRLTVANGGTPVFTAL